MGKIIGIYRIQIPQTTSDFDPLKTIASRSPQKGRDPIQKGRQSSKKNIKFEALKLSFPLGVEISQIAVRSTPNFSLYKSMFETSRKAREVAGPPNRGYPLITSCYCIAVSCSWYFIWIIIMPLEDWSVYPDWYVYILYGWWKSSTQLCGEFSISHYKDHYKPSS